MDETCSECRAPLPVGKKCRAYLDELIAWEFNNPLDAGQTHLMTIMCYNLQHPSIYSKEGLMFGIDTLLTVMDGSGVDAVREARKSKVFSPADMPHLTLMATETNIASYVQPPVWTITADQVVANGIEGYADFVRAWATSIYYALLESGNLA